MIKNGYILEMKNISKSFPGVKALDGVSLKIKAGTVHALMGENGAGKSTLMKCAFGIYHQDEGTIYFEGKNIKLLGPSDAMEKGIAMIHQELHPIKVRNVMENIWIGRTPYRKLYGVKWVDEKKMYQNTMDLFKKLDISINPRALAGELSSSVCQLMEIARAISYGAKVIIMDEPTSSLTKDEAENLFKIIRKITKEGTAVIYISHKMDEILKISDEVTIMRDGRTVGTWQANELTQQLIISKMVGREIKNQFPPKNHSIGDIRLKIEHLTSSDKRSFKDISFDVHRGEVFGIGGLVGSQRTELMESIFGLRPIEECKISLDNKCIKINSSKEAIQNKIAFVTEERRATGIIPMLNITDNMVITNQIANRKCYKRKSIFLNNKLREKDTKKYVDSLEIKTPSLKTQIQYLSGGNQQKVLLARWLLIDPNILILDEPTRGIDVGTKYEIYCLIENMVKEGKSVIIISSEMPELIGISDRIMIMCEGHNSGILMHEDVTEEKIMELASSYKIAE